MIQKCPICNGRGMVAHGFYPDDEQTEHPACRACDGRGIVRWGDVVPQPYPVPYPVYPMPWWIQQPRYQPYIVTNGIGTAAPVTVPRYQITSVTA